MSEDAKVLPDSVDFLRALAKYGDVHGSQESADRLREIAAEVAALRERSAFHQVNSEDRLERLIAAENERDRLAKEVEQLTAERDDWIKQCECEVAVGSDLRERVDVLEAEVERLGADCKWKAEVIESTQRTTTAIMRKQAARVAVLEEALADACETASLAITHMDSTLREKWHMDEDLAKARAALAELGRKR